MNVLIIIDFWSDWTHFRHGDLFLSEDYAKYLLEKKNNCVELIKKIINNKNWVIINADYSEGKWEVMKDPILKQFNIKPNIKYNIDLLQDKNVYICGSSFDQCIINRKLGYKNIKCKTKMVVKDCCWYGDNRMLPRNYLITNKKYYRDTNSFASIKEIKNDETAFLKINKIGWVLSQNIK